MLTVISLKTHNTIAIDIIIACFYLDSLLIAEVCTQAVDGDVYLEHIKDTCVVYKSPNASGKVFPLGTQRCCDVESTSLTLIPRRNNVVCQVGCFTPLSVHCRDTKYFTSFQKLHFSAQYHGHHYTLHRSFHNNLDHSMHNHKDRQPVRLGFEPGTSRLLATAEPNEPSGQSSWHAHTSCNKHIGSITHHQPNTDSTLGQRLQRWTSVKSALYLLLIFVIDTRKCYDQWWSQNMPDARRCHRCLRNISL